MAAHRVILLPGSVLPANLAYSSLIEALGSDADAVAKDLEVYAGPTPPSDYTLDHEVEGIRRVANEHGWGSFHLVGYSGGGASVLAFTARHPAQVSSLALLEPAWAGNWPDISPEHRATWEQYALLDRLPEDEFMREFMRLGVRPEVVLSPPPWAVNPPSWMRLRPAGIRAFLRTFAAYDLDRAALADYHRPVYFALGGLSKPDDYGEIADRLGRTFSDYTVEVFPDRHHFDPPHRAEPERVAASLRQLWSRAGEA